MTKTYRDSNTMTEREILDEVQFIAALSPDEITVDDARRSYHLRNCLWMIERAREPYIAHGAVLTNALGES